MFGRKRLKARIVELETELSYQQQEADQVVIRHLVNVLYAYSRVWSRFNGENTLPKRVIEASDFARKHFSGYNGIQETKRQIVWRQGNGICYLCDEPLDPWNWTIDHVIPKSKGGTNSLDNLMPTHEKCNMLKADRIFETARQRRHNRLLG